jgi:hypothetical protein
MNKHGWLYLAFCLVIITGVGCGSSDSTSPNTQANALLTISANPAAVADESYSTVTATLKNLAGTPIFGYLVSFSITQNESKCTLTIVNDLTDIKGNATVIYKSGTVKGVDIVQASCVNVNPASVAIYVTPKASPTPSPTPTPKATPTPSPTPTPKATPTPTPTPTSSKFLPFKE